MDSFKNRLTDALNHKNMSKAELSRKTGIGRNSISDYTNGRYEAKQNYVSLIAKALNINESWLLGYDTKMEKQEIRESPYRSITVILEQLERSRKEKILIFAKDQLNEQNKKSDNVE